MFGSYLLPQTLSVNFEDAHLVYTTKPPSTPFDQFMHIVKCKSDNLRIMLVPSPKYSGKIDEYVIFLLYMTKERLLFVHSCNHFWDIKNPYMSRCVIFHYTVYT